MSDKNMKQRILVVEESATLRYILSKSIEKLGYELLTAESFDAAQKTLQKGSLDLHGILLGWPSHEHFNESRQLTFLLEREPYSELPVIVLSNSPELEILNWISTRDKSALVPWETYQEAVITLQSMISPPDEPIEDVREEVPGEKPIRVLFVDDSKSILIYYLRLLERHGYQVETAMSVKEAYELALKKTFDIAIVDYFMPGENGVVLCQMLRDHPDTANIRTAVLTGTYLDVVIKDCLTAGAIECMFKNEAEELFLSRISAMRRFIEIQRSTEQQREHLAAILESVGEGVYGVDNNGKITFVNPATLSVLGLDSFSELINQSAYESFHFKDDSSATEDQLRKAYRSGSELRSWETRFKHASGKIIPVECTLYPLEIDEVREGSVVAFRDISNQKMLEEKLRWQATHDHLTELYNRRYFEQELESELEQVKRSGIMSALVYLDLDRFKYVNDTIGHEAGDALLVDVSHVLMKCIRRNDVVARIGGDEFGFILRNVDDDTATALAGEFQKALLKLKMEFEDKSYIVNASVGIALMDDENLTAGDVLANADVACNIAKRSGGSSAHVYRKGNDERNIMGTELGWSARIRGALSKDGFELRYQPILSLSDVDLNNLPAQNGVLWKRHLDKGSKSYHYEVLIRLKGENSKLFYPSAFIPTAERFNLMIDIDMWVLEHSLKELAALGDNKDKVVISVNLSGHTLDSDDTRERIKALLDKYKVPPSSLVLEITETSAIANIDQVSQLMENLTKIGCRFSLDDFGSGFCSFSQLRNLKTDYVKIDGQFVKSMARGSTDRAIVTAMNDVAHSLNRHTVAEFVESPEVVRLLKICGVDKVQGYYVSAPLTTLPHGNVINKKKAKS